MFRFALGLLLAVLALPAHAQFEQSGDLSVRLDDSNNRDRREQYRLRWNPRFRFDERWSAHAFLATGADFDSAYNTVDDSDDEGHVRRLFVRYESERGKFEAGILPPYKGRVSSTGLSKEGWIKGARLVMNTGRGQLEAVVGELDDLQARRALSLPVDVDYFELEYSGRINDRYSFETSIDRVFDDNFLRGELRIENTAAGTFAFELIHNLDSDRSKAIVSMDRDIKLAGRKIDWFTYVAYADDAFGLRATLTEDFLDFGRALSTELSGGFQKLDSLGWFVKLEVYEQRTRGQLGLEWDF